MIAFRLFFIPGLTIGQGLVSGSGPVVFFTWPGETREDREDREDRAAQDYGATTRSFCREKLDSRRNCLSMYITVWSHSQYNAMHYSALTH